MEKNKKKIESNGQTVIPIEAEIVPIQNGLTAFEAGDHVVIMTPAGCQVCTTSKIQKTLDSDGNFVSAKVVLKTRRECLSQNQVPNVIYLPKNDRTD